MAKLDAVPVFPFVLPNIIGREVNPQMACRGCVKQLRARAKA